MIIINIQVCITKLVVMRLFFLCDFRASSYSHGTRDVKSKFWLSFFECGLVLTAPIDIHSYCSQKIYDRNTWNASYILFAVSVWKTSWEEIVQQFVKFARHQIRPLRLDYCLNETGFRKKTRNIRIFNQNLRDSKIC